MELFQQAKQGQVQHQGDTPAGTVKPDVEMPDAPAIAALSERREAAESNPADGGGRAGEHEGQQRGIPTAAPQHSGVYTDVVLRQLLAVDGAHVLASHAQQAATDGAALGPCTLGPGLELVTVVDVTKADIGEEAVEEGKAFGIYL